MERPLRVAVMAASNRRGSLNRRLLRRIDELLSDRGVDVDVIDLRELPLPIYDADLQAEEGIPDEAVAAHDRIVAADAVVFAVPEYNGGYPALFKNTLDWITRVDMFVLHPRYVGVVSTTPGKGGGQRGIEHTRALLGNMFVTTHEGYALPAGHESLTSDGWTDEASDDAARLAEWVDAFVEAAGEFAEKQAANAA